MTSSNQPRESISALKRPFHFNSIATQHFLLARVAAFGLDEAKPERSQDNGDAWWPRANGPDPS